VSSDPVAFEAFETFDDTVVVFLGAMGTEGALVHRGGERWDFFARDSVEWDGLHQEVFRNGRARRLGADDLARRGIALPPLEEYRGRPPGRWTDRFPIEMPARKAPRALRARLEAGTLTVHLILFEDRYETSFGDGKFLYPQAALVERERAEAWIRAKVDAMTSAEERQWHAYSVKPVLLRLDAARGVLATDPQGPYEHWGVRELVSHLSLT
jgi:hypothetical protein